MKHNKSIPTLSVFNRFKPSANGECRIEAQATPASTAQRAIRPTENAAPPTESPSSSKSPLSILKLFANKIRPRAGTSETHCTDTLTTAEQERREAALRERGLLPALKRNKDVSHREREWDQHLPIIQPIADPLMTPAKQIKKEWEARKQFQIWEEEERERLNRFRFGSQSTPVNETQAHGRPSPPSGASAMSAPPMLVLSGRASTDEDIHIQPPTLGASGAPTPQSLVNDHSHSTDHLPTFIPITPVSAPLDACPVTSLPPQTSVVTQTDFESGPPPCPAITPVPLETTFQEDATSPRHQWSDSCLASSESEAHTFFATPSADIPHTGSFPVLSTSDPSLRFSIPTIVESSIDDGLPPEKAILNPVTETLQKGQCPRSKRKKRRTVFSDNQPGKRLAITTSLSSLRRSVASTLMRTRSSMNLEGLRLNRDDALSLETQTAQLTGISNLDALDAPRRQAVAPTLHSQGSILLQTNAIEDEEARRIAELAYLG